MQGEVEKRLATMAGRTASRAAAGQPDARTAMAMAEARRRTADDTKAALEWALQQGELARPALDIVMEAWTRADPSGAFAAAREIPEDQPPGLRAYGLARVGELWAATDPASAWKAVGTLPASYDTALLKNQVIRSWSEKDPAAAAESLKALAGTVQTREDQTFLQSVLAGMAGKLVAQNAAKAAEWAAGFPDGTPEQGSAVAGVVNGWYEKDAKAAGEWVDHLAAGAARDAGVMAMVHLTAMREPEASVEWAQTVSEPALRANLMAYAAAGWLTINPKKAEAWIQKTGALTNEQRENILAGYRQLREVNGTVRGK